MAEYIERDALVHHFMTKQRYLTKDLVMDAACEISKIPAADVVEVVRCKDCDLQYGCKVGQYLGNDGFCSYGERREDG